MSQLIKIIKFYGRFLLSFTAIGYVWRSLSWPRLDADLSGQTWLVTGASGGVGRAIVLEAARRGATVLAAARSAAKLDQLVADARAQDGSKGKVVPLVADFALKRDARKFAEELLRDQRRIDVLVNNVGVLLDDFTVTDEGHETSFTTNILSHFILTERLIEGGAMVRGGAVINMSSGGMYNVPLAVGAMDAKKAENFNGVRAYALHKRGQAALTSYWSETYGASRALVFYVMHPGWADTQGVKTSLPTFRHILQWILRTAEQGADTAIWLGATRPQGTDPDGFWLDRKPRPAHAYEFTKISKHRPADVANCLKSLSVPAGT